MKRILMPLFICLLLAVAAHAQSGPEAEVAAQVRRFNQALVSADRGELEKLTSGQLSYGHSSGKVQDKAEFVEDVVSGPFDFETVEAEGQMITVAGETAVVRHVFTSKATNNGAPVSIRIGNMQVWQKQEGQWKLLARQAYKL